MAYTKNELKQERRNWWYWQEREAAIQAKLTEKNAYKINTHLKKYYRHSMKEILGQFEATYNKVFSRILEGKEVTPADLYKLDSYWKMKAQVHNELQKLGDKQLDLLTENFIKQYQDIYNSIAWESQSHYSTIDTKTVEQIINSIWCADGKSWSSRIWTNTERLQETLDENLIHCVITGKQPKELKQLLMKRFDVSFSAADSLVRTELAHIQTEAAKQRYIDNGISKVQIWADPDERRCPICADLHKKIYLPDANIPIPAHPRCRCCIIPVVE